MSVMLNLRGLRGFAVPVLFVLSSVSGGAEASNSFLEDSKRGWFWYEEPEVAEGLQEKAALPPQEISAETEDDSKERERRVARLSENTVDEYVEGLPKTAFGELKASDLRPLLPKTLEFAVDNPSPANVLRYFTLQRMTMNKSERFATESRRLVKLNPELDEMAGAVKPQKLREADERSESRALHEKLRILSEKVILVYVYQGTCPYCKMGVAEVNALAASGFKVMGISLDGVLLNELKADANIHEPGAAAFYGISSVPVLIAVDAQGSGESGHTVIMSGGLLNLSELKYRLVNAVR